jgi:hypothetical protein
MSPATKAANVAMSIRDHGYDVNDVSTWIRYGLSDNVAQQQLVRLALGRQ